MSSGNSFIPEDSKLLILSNNFTLPTSGFIYWWEQVLHTKKGECEKYYWFSLSCLVDQCHFKYAAPKLYAFLQRSSLSTEKL